MAPLLCLRLITSIWNQRLSKEINLKFILPTDLPSESNVVKFYIFTALVNGIAGLTTQYFAVKTTLTPKEIFSTYFLKLREIGFHARVKIII